MLAPFLPGVQAAVRPPRVAALEWLPADLLLALGVAPLALADKNQYLDWVGHHPLLEQAIDAGRRIEPNLELLQQLHPDLILLTQGYGPEPQMLAPIGETLTFAVYDGHARPLQQLRDALHILAARLELAAVAEHHLAAMDTTFARIRRRIPASLAPVAVATQTDALHLTLFTHTSLFQDVLTQLGLSNAWQGNDNPWGAQQVRLEQLTALGEAHVFCIRPPAGAATMTALPDSSYWRNLPFVAAKRLHMMPPVWSIGGTLAAIRFAQLLEQALEASGLIPAGSRADAP